jgi:hypothetical protein
VETSAKADNQLIELPRLIDGFKVISPSGLQRTPETKPSRADLEFVIQHQLSNQLNSPATELPLRMLITDGDDFFGAAEFQETDVSQRRLDEYIGTVQ